MDKLIVSLLGVIGIGGIYWFFFRKHGETDGTASDTWNIQVNGGYKPGTVVIPHGTPSTLIFTRTDPNSYLEDVVIADFKIKTFLPLNTPITVTLSPTKPGTFDMHCGMNMFHGKVIVV